MNLFLWANKWGVSADAVMELRREMGVDPTGHLPCHINLTDETSVQNMRRLQAAKEGRILWRNNVGVLKDERGVPVRFGLANDSAKQNKQVKSSDLIGITPVTITSGMVGTVIGQFTAEECKRPGWKYTGSEREEAQRKFMEIVISHGGRASFVSGIDADVICGVTSPESKRG